MASLWKAAGLFSAGVLLWVSTCHAKEARGISANGHAKNYGLLVGVSHGLPAIDIDLNNMEAMDTNAAYNFTNFRMLDAQATEAAMLTELSHQSKQVDNEGTLLFYFSGHGDPGVIISQDVNTKVEKLRDAIRAGRDGLSPLARLVLIFDSCYAGSLLNIFNDNFELTNFAKVDEAAASQRMADAVTAAFTDDLRDAPYWKSLFVFASSRADETSLGGMNGSNFTVALKKAFDETLAAKGNMAKWVELSKQYTTVHHPVERFEPASLANEPMIP